MKVLVIYDTVTGNTGRMAVAVGEGVKAEGVEVSVVHVSKCTVNDLVPVDGIIFGSPVYFGLPSAAIKEFIDHSNAHFGKLSGKVGGAFANSAGYHGGCETTLMALNQALLIHGMIVQGEHEGFHYGAAAVGLPNEEALTVCKKLGARVAKLVKRLNK